MLTYNFDEKENLSLYEFLYKKIKEDILKNRLKKNEKLPSKRALAKHLSVSVITIEHAYAQLLAEGYIYSIEKRGYFVAELEENLMIPINSAKIVPLKQPQKQNYFADLTGNNICSEHFPFSIWARLMRDVLSDRNEILLQKAPCNGVLELRQAISEYLYHFHGMQVIPEQILIGAGTEYLYSLLIQLIGRNYHFAVEDPGYPKIGKIYKNNGVTCSYLPLDKDGLTISSLEQSQADIVHISPSHHFPTGRIMPIKRRQELLQWANAEEHRYIIEDDYDSEFRYLGKPIKSLQSIDTNQKVIYMNTFSKSIAPSIRIGYMILPYKFINKYHNDLDFYSCTVSNFEQYTLAKFIKKGYYEQHINRMRNFYRKQRDYLLKELKNSPFKDKISIHEENAGLHFILNIKTTLTDQEIIHLAQRQGIKLSCLSEYYYNPDDAVAHKIIINYSGILKEQIPEIIERLSKIF